MLHATLSPHSFRTLLLSFPFPSLPQAHAKEALELVHMQQQTAQVKHHEEYKVCVSAYSCTASPLFYLSLFLPRLPSPASPFPPLPPSPFPLPLLSYCTIIKAAGLALVAFDIYTARMGTGIVERFIEARVGKPSLLGRLLLLPIYQPPYSSKADCVCM